MIGQNLFPVTLFTMDANLQLNTFVLGIGFFFFCFIVARKILEKYFPLLADVDNVVICVKLVSSVQGFIAVAVGWVICQNCQNDIMHDRHWLTHSYTWFGLSYFFYDTLAMYYEHLCKVKLTKITTMYLPFFSLKYWGGLLSFLISNKSIAFHHVILPILLGPAILVFRRGLGDYLIGLLFQMEISVPFIAVRNILVQLNMKGTRIYTVVGLSMIAVFFISRILIFPYVYWQYGQHTGIALIMVPISIPIKCNLGCAAVLTLQVYWLTKMVKGAIKMFSRKRQH